MKKVFNYILQSPYNWLSAAGFLFLLSFFFTNRFTHQGSLKQEWKKIQNYISNNEKKFEDITHDSTLLNKLINHTETRAESSTMADRLFGFFLYKKNTVENGNMLFWSSQESTPPESLLMEPDNGYFKKLANGYFLCIKKTISRHNKSDSIIAIGLIPVLYDYYVETVYSSNRFAHSKKAGGSIAVTKEITSYPVKNSKNEIIFYVEGKAVSKTADINNIVIWLRLVAVILILLFIHYYAERSVKLHGIINGVAFLIISLLILRIISYYTSFPFRLHQFELFDPAVYGANPVQKSLGDLLINAIFFCWITLFVWNKIKDLKFDWKTKFSQTRIRLFGIIALIFIVAITFMMAKIIRSLAADSNISFDVINFFSLTRFTVSGFAALSILAIGYYFLIRILLYLVDVSFFENYFLIYFVIAITGLMYLTIKISHPLLKFYIVVLAWLLFYIRLQRMKNFSINYSRLNIANSLFWIFLFSVSITAIIIIANREKEWEIRKRLADKIDVQSDPYNERQLNISFTYLDDDFLNNNFYRFENKETNRTLRDSIMREGGYLNKFDSRLYVFDSDGKALYNDDAESFNTLNTIINVQAKPTHKADLYFFETSFEKFTFIFKREAKDFSGKIMGSLFIVSNPEQYSSDALYPELFRQRKTNNPEESPVYSFATYKSGILITRPSNEYSFATTLLPEDKPVKQFEKRINNKSDELWYRSANEKVVVIAKKRDSEIEAITLFSYVFCAFLVLVGLFNILSVILKLSRHPDDLKRLFQWNIRTQVHSTIIFISVVSFIIIGIATISFFIKRYGQNNKEKLNGTMQIMVNEMEKNLDRQKVFDDQLAIYDSVANQGVQKLVNEVAEIHNVDVNVYDTIGNLQVTSQPLIYRVGFLSKKIHPLAYYHLSRLRQVQYVQEEKLASLNYLSIYAPMRDEKGKVYAYLNIPYFLSQHELKQEISYFLVTIINLNAFIFLIAGVIALFITNRVTRSFSIISEKMKEVNLGKTNEEINWKRDDEIGELVTEYNKMVNKLEVSAAALAQSEREGAWREMARQVAHEIKNPLTPMKLSIQFLQKSIDNNTGNVKELTSSVARTLVEQIDHLSKIAFDFSQFANIGNTYPEKFDLKDVLFSLRDLYQMNENVELIIHELPGECVLYSDKTQMNRLFTNLFQNALEACNGKEKCKIEVNATKNDGLVTVSIKDNGEGIPEGMQSQIFAPNFTTKSSGTGLGLAMCKGIVEQAKGKIWFETKRGIGTEFFVELPLGD